MNKFAWQIPPERISDEQLIQTYRADIVIIGAEHALRGLQQKQESPSSYLNSSAKRSSGFSASERLDISTRAGRLNMALPLSMWMSL